MHIFLHAEADHAVSVQHTAEFTDGAVALRFKLDDARDSLGLDFADLARKDIHAGHLFAARLSPKQVLLQDLATGGMRLDIQNARKTKQRLTADQQQALVGKEKKIPAALALHAWHDLLLKITGDELAVTVDGQLLGTLKSPGIAHPTKKTLRRAVSPVAASVSEWPAPPLAASIQSDAFGPEHSKLTGDFVGRPLAGAFSERMQAHSPAAGESFRLRPACLHPTRNPPAFSAYTRDNTRG